MDDKQGSAKKRGRGLNLNEMLLRPREVHAGTGGVAGGLTDEVIGAADREIRHAHVLGTKGDEIVYGRGVEALDIGAEELAAWI